MEIDEFFGDDSFFEYPADISTAPEYKIFKREDANEMLKTEIEEVSKLLMINEDKASILLRYFCFDRIKLEETWFERMESIEKELGFTYEIQKIPNSLTCGICFDIFDEKDVIFLNCKHM